MKLITLVCAAILFTACNNAIDDNATAATNNSLQGTWKLITGTLVENNNTTVTDYTHDTSFIKIINADHFSFLTHNLNKKDSAAAFFSCGGGKYDLQDSTYTEHLEYCDAREWEGQDFTFTVHINNDTLVQQGIEKIDSLGVNRVNTEKYVRMK